MADKISSHNQEIISLVEQLKERSIGFNDVPKEYRYYPLIVSVERALGIRKAIRKGFDIIRGVFFVDEQINDKKSTFGDEITICFDNFSSYYDFLHGDIYDDSCYYGFCFTKEIIAAYNIDLDKLNFDALINNTVDDFTLNLSKNEYADYQSIETRKKAIIKELNELNTCGTCGEFRWRMTAAENSACALELFLTSFIFHDKQKAFDIVMDYINHCRYHAYSFDMAKMMCLIYAPQSIVAAYKNIYCTQSIAKEYEINLKQFVAELENGSIRLREIAYFDKQTHFFVSHTIGEHESGSNATKVVELRRYFETFKEFTAFRNNDLSYCDLSKAIIPDLDLSQYKIGAQTKLPIQYQKNFIYSVEKIYDRKEDRFIVNQNWMDKQGFSIKSYRHTFKYFFDFVHFLKGDLSNADLLFCEGLANIYDFTGLNFNNAKLRSLICDKLGIKYDVSPNFTFTSFPAIQKNEEETDSILILAREVDKTFKCRKIFYVSDLHLIHKLNNAKCKSINDITFTIQKIIDTLLSHIGAHGYGDDNVLLISGDTSSEFVIFEQFIHMLKITLDNERLRLNVIFTLGNHELWGFDQYSFESIVIKYRNILADNGMLLLQNNIIFRRDGGDIGEIDTEELKLLSQKELRLRLLKARIIIFGGLAFAGYNKEFNADQSIYKSTLDTQQEIEETKKFETLYNKICADLPDKRVIILTHMPPSDWCSNFRPHRGFIYVNGHTHRNYFYDDGDYRIYADNQIGYDHTNTHLKYFYINDDYDIFTDYENGIYPITREQYLDFYKGKKLGITFTKEPHKLFMLKNNEYYMFISQNSSGDLMILHGGATKKLAYRDINYYFNKMPEVVSHIKPPLDDFTKFQKQISNAIKSFGGSGTIHGAIIDIDFFNHIYVNPLDSTITPYYAVDIIQKFVFPDVPTLLRAKCPALYESYLKKIEGGTSYAIISQRKKDELVIEPQPYLYTDIYNTSREINKIQRLNSHILSTWIEPSTKKLDMIE